MFQNKLKNKVLLVAALTAFYSTAQADMYLAPYAGYSSASLKLKTPAAVTTEVTMKNPIFGLSIGYRSMTGADLTLNGTYVKGTADSKTAGVTTKVKNEHKTGSVQLGLNLSAMRVYLGYIAMNDLKSVSEDETDSTTFTGSGYQAGLEFALTTRLTVNVQYDLHQFSKVKDNINGTTSNMDDVFEKSDSQTTSAGLKFYF